MSRAYYNEFDPFAAQWLRNLIAAGHIAPGDVDERSIADVRPEDLEGYTQCHFFAGIGGWSYAARLAGWPDDLPLWSGSCPCQPFSAAGARKGFANDRHLWPEFLRLIRARRPSVVVGEQVASKDGLRWLDRVSADLEDADYARWAADFCAAGVEAPHIRQRLWWLAARRDWLEHAARDGWQPWRPQPEWRRVDGRCFPDRRVGHAAVQGLERHAERSSFEKRPATQRAGRDDRRVGDANGAGLLSGYVPAASARHGRAALSASGDDRSWRRYELVFDRDGKARRVEPGSFPLAHGVSARVGRLRAYGNAIVPEEGAEILSAFLEGPPAAGAAA
jgi:DNA (cytosine-5)-methyltransferase 1